MDGYPSAFMAHNIPLIFVSGLSSASQVAPAIESGIHLSSDQPHVESKAAADLLQNFQDSDASQLAWNSEEFANKNRFRNYTLPIRTATASLLLPPPLSPTSKPVLHSTLSPLSPDSLLFPDGLIDTKWILKHQELVPSVFITFYALTSDPDLSKFHDDQCKLDINRIKTNLSESGYKTRLFVVLLGDTKTMELPIFEKRVAIIRRETGLDIKNCVFFLSSQSSTDELNEFFKTTITSIYSICIEYYRDLGKHSRRKKNRGAIPRPTAPPTSGTSQTLSSQGWNFRYDFKLGVFAEFRQEMELALRFYEGAYEALLGPDILEAIASWSSRWNEARLLADVLTFRVIRCLLWHRKFTSAVHRWISHKERIKDFVDRRGKGSTTYGWEAWEARWATLMAETIKKVSIPEFDGNAIYLPLDQSIGINEKMQPWEYLHHPGFWFRCASNHLIARRNLALQIPKEDRLKPRSSAGSHTVSKGYTYDTYLCPPPHEENPLPGHQGVDHSKLILDLLKKSISEFEQRKQVRLAQELKILSAHEYMKQNAWTEALKILLELRQNMSYRKECWWNAVEEVLWTLRKAAAHVGDAASIIAVDWELMNHDFTCHSSWPYDLATSLKGLCMEAKPTIVLQSKDIHSFLNASYTFDIPKGKVGETCSSKFVVSSTAVLSAAPVTISEIKISFEGSMKPITLRHKETPEITSCESSPTSITEVDLSEISLEGFPAFAGDAFLTFKPGHISVFKFINYLTEPGDVKAISAKFSILMDDFHLDYIQDLQSNSIPGVKWEDKYRRKKLVRGNIFSITVSPKPPKMELQLGVRHDQYYVNEQIILRVIVTNEENDDAVVNFDAQLLGEQISQITWEVEPSSNVDFDTDEGDQITNLIGTRIGKISRGKSATVKIIIPSLKVPAKYELLIKAAYLLVSNMNIPVYKTVSTELPVINPFETRCDLSSRIHPEPWPSLFTHEERENLDADCELCEPGGLAQKWCFTARYTSLVTLDIIITDVNVEILTLNDGIRCVTKKLTDFPEGGQQLTSKTAGEVQFDIIARKLSLDDRGTANLDMSLAISWHRDSPESVINHTIISVPRLLAFSSEPRALVAVSYSFTIPFIIYFDVMIENPSNHFLSFSLSMESNENIAFSGMRQSILQLLPLSRKKIEYRMLPSVRGQWIGPVQCIVRDRYFQKVLRIAPTEGMKGVKEGIMIWVPPEEN